MHASIKIHLACSQWLSFPSRDGMFYAVALEAGGARVPFEGREQQPRHQGDPNDSTKSSTKVFNTLVGAPGYGAGFK